MVRHLLFTLTILFIGTLASAQTILAGKVTDADTKEPIILGNVAVYQNGVLKTGQQTDFDGNFRINNLDPGTYVVEFSYVGYQPQKITNVVVFAGKTNALDVEMTAGQQLTTVVVSEHKVPLIEQDNTTQGGTITSKEIRNLPTKNINALAASTAGVASIDGGAVNVKGSRSDATNYYIDGIRVAGALIPQSEIDQLQVITGGIEAKYGDVTGGIISLTTKGPSSTYSGSVELETSQYLDAFGYNLGSVNVSGPILKKKSGEPILGFRISGQYVRRQEDDPPATSVFKAKPEVIDALEVNPIVVQNGTKLSAAEFLKNKDVNTLKARPDEESTGVDLTAKLELRVNKNVDLSFTGTYNDSRNKFTPGGWGLINYRNNPTAYSNRYRGFLRFRQRLGSGNDEPQQPGATAAAPAKRSATIRNASYVIQGGFERGTGLTYDPRHKDRFFDYGYVGKNNWEWVNAYGASAWSGAANTFGIAHVDFRQVFNGYDPSTSTNPVLSNYNNQSDYANFNELVTYNSFVPDLYSSAWGQHTNIGIVYNRYNKNVGDTYTGQANFQFDFLPNGSDKGAHNIQFGLIYEQRVNSSWTIAPNGLWLVGRLQANRQILGVDTSRIIGYDTDLLDDLGPFLSQLIDSLPIFDRLITTDPKVTGVFYKNIRKVTGQTEKDFVNVDGVDPSLMRLDMFSAQELNDQGIIDYYGYDYLGNKLGSKVTFDDFFRSRDENGIRLFPVAAQRPTYQAAFIQDKFTINNMFFRVGVRVDRYDANTKVFKDPYSMYEVMDAKDFYANVLQKDKPSNIGDAYKIYVDGDGSKSIKAFREGDQWYSSNGTRVSDGNIIFGGGLVYPYYKRAGTKATRITDDDFDPNESFQDYEPQVTVMPRLAFSFPISDIANFFAHYDVLVQRPPSNTNATALDYYYWNVPGRFGSDNIRDNANLKPERTVDYEVGFQQKLSNNSALKIAAYYKEMRDMIQLRTYLFLPAPVTQYVTYGNLDFGTVKGFTFQYDLRRTGNVSATLNYTLQFADGTGSDAQSQRGLTDRGNIRTLFPLNFDERNRFSLTLDYRYDEGRKYNGPKWFGTDVFANAGINLQCFAVSGRPYTAKLQPTAFGGTSTKGAINGSRLPWNFSVDIRVDKSFTLSKPGAANPIGLNIYLRVQNLLNTKNVLGVYPATGSPTDDGYLASSFGQDAIQNVIDSGRDIEAYLNSYQWSLLNPNSYSLPRRISIGALLEF